ncbi:putative pseudouridine synthase, RsuA/RluA, pseudouridine synthase, catalytic domain superfamily [Helianthus anomalus]
MVSRFPVDVEINSKSYLWRGNPWNLEVDVVVNSTNENMDKAHCSPGLHDAAVPGLAEECATMDPVLLVLNKPPKVPVKGNLPVHNSMDGLAAAALCYDYDGGPKPVHRLDREGSGITLMGRSKESISHLHWLFSDINRTKYSFKVYIDHLYDNRCHIIYQFIMLMLSVIITLGRE